MPAPSLLLYLLSLALSYTTVSSAECYGLAFQGGSDKGAYQAGAFSALVNNTAGGNVQYDVVSGVSFGAINAAWISQFPKGQEQTAADELVQLWTDIKSSDVYKQWPGSVVQGLLFEPALYNTEPGSEYLKKHLTQSPQRYLSVGATNADNAIYKSFNNFAEDLSVDALIDAVMASAALPGFFPYRVIDNTAYIDGGAILSVDLGSIISKCREITNNDDTSIHIDVVLITAVNFQGANASDYNGIKMLMRTLELMSYHSAISGLVQAQNTYPNVHLRYLIQPSGTLPDSPLPISFNHKDIVKMIEKGAEDATNAIKKGEGVSFKEFMNDAHERLGRRSSERAQEQLFEEFFLELKNVMKQTREDPNYF